jgi:hypothetical protein
MYVAMKTLVLACGLVALASLGVSPAHASGSYGHFQSYQITGNGHPIFLIPLQPVVKKQVPSNGQPVTASADHVSTVPTIPTMPTLSRATGASDYSDSNSDDNTAVDTKQSKNNNKQAHALSAIPADVSRSIYQ